MLCRVSYTSVIMSVMDEEHIPGLYFNEAVLIQLMPSFPQKGRESLFNRVTSTHFQY